MKQFLFGMFVIVSMALLNACIPSPPVDDIQSTPVYTETFTPTLTIEPTKTQTPNTPTPFLQSQICSPLKTESLQSIKEIITQPFKQPRMGIDDGPPTHHGVDFSHYRRGDLISIEGVTVQSVLAGEVATIINNQYPYGYTVIIETLIDAIDPELLEKINPPIQSPTVIPDPKFNWEPQEFPFELSDQKRSIYIVYAHLLSYPEIHVGEEIQCGQQVGQVGNTGDSSNPHLHFESRIGPSGARFESMAYYTTQSTKSERYNYLVWRISNLFQLFDPMLLLNAYE